MFKGAEGDGRPRWRVGGVYALVIVLACDGWIGRRLSELEWYANAWNRSAEGCGEMGRLDTFIFANVRAGARVKPSNHDTRSRPCSRCHDSDTTAALSTLSPTSSTLPNMAL